MTIKQEYSWFFKQSNETQSGKIKIRGFKKPSSKRVRNTIESDLID